jgi:hypothetical protein
MNMTQKALLLDRSSIVATAATADGSVSVRMGNDENGVILVGGIADLCRIVSEVRRQLSQEVIQS